MKLYVLCLSIFIFNFSLSVHAAEDNESVAKKLQNPIADLISVPFQLNIEEGFGKDDKGERSLLNFQPVIPVSISEKWNLINRPIVPVISQTSLPNGTQNGFGDILYESFLSPKSSSFIWGIGPVLSLPTASKDELGSGRWSAGPTAVILNQKGPLTYGLLAFQVWSFAGDKDREEVNQTYFQPFYSYTTKKALSISIGAEHTINNQIDKNIGYGVLSATQVLKIKGQLISLQVGYKQAYTGPEELKFDRGLRFQLSFIFPKEKH